MKSQSYDLQKKLLSNLKKTSSSQTYEELSRRTGIQKTRLFRLFQGQELRFSEVLMIQKALGLEKDFHHLFYIFLSSLNQFDKTTISDLMNTLERRVKLFTILKT